MMPDAGKSEENKKLENEETSSDLQSYDTDTQYDMDSELGKAKFDLTDKDTSLSQYLDTDTDVDADRLNKIITNSEATSLDVNAMIEKETPIASNKVAETPSFQKNNRRHSNDAIKEFDANATDEFNFNNFEETQDEVLDEEDVPAEDSSGKDDKFHRPASILDLIRGKDETLPIVTYEEGDDLDKRLEGKSLDDVLNITQKDKEGWHESKKAKESKEEKAAAAKIRQRKLFVATPVILFFAGVICFYIVLPSFNPPMETDAIKLPKRKRKTITPEKLKIDSNLKDAEKLEKYYQMAENLFSDKKYDKAEIVYKKLLPTEWRLEHLLAKIGECRDSQKDIKGAVKFYTKAIKAGYGTDVTIPLRLGNLLKEQKKYQEIDVILSPLQERFINKTHFQLLMADAYWNLKMPKKTLKAFRSINKQFLDKEQLKAFASLLVQDGDKKAAFNVYLFLAQNFHDIDSFVKASEIAPNPKLKIAVLTELIGKSMGKPGWNYYNLLLGECLISQGKKKDALKVLEAIKPKTLRGDYAFRFLKLVADFEESKSLTESCETILIKHYINNLPVQEDIRNILFDANKRRMAEKIFAKQVVKFPHSSIANYMFAKATPSVKLQNKYFNLALDLNPQFFSAALALGKLYCDEGNLNEAIDKFKLCININPKTTISRYWLALATIRKTNNATALVTYQNFLQDKGLKESSILKQMVLLAQFLPTDTEAMKYIKIMEKFPELNAYRERQTIRTKLMYGTLKADDFKGMTAEGLKKYRILFLLAEGKIKQVMMMPILKHEFPDYWKVFLCWRKNISSWRGNCQLLQFKHPNDLLITLSVKLWQWEISPAEAEKQMGRLKYEDKPLLYLMIAERYRRDKNKIKASIAYLTAMRYKQPNIYSNVVKYFKNHYR